MRKGLIHIYCGEGKGKTSAALGLAIRAAGRGLGVVVVRLMKDCDSGELDSLKKLPEVTVVPAPEKLKFVFEMDDAEKEQYREMVSSMLYAAGELIINKNADVLIIDEACSAVTTGMLELEELIGFIKNKPENLEVVLTGRDPPRELIELADYVSEIKKIKHPFDNSTPPRLGIEL